MDNLITCEYCGTVYDPSDGPCPICQGQPEDMDNYMGDHFDYDERPVEEEITERRPVGGRIAALLALLVLFVGFTGYILYAFEKLPFLKPAETVSEPEQIPCTALAIDADQLTLTEEGQTVQINSAVEPADTTDRLIFSVDNSDVVSVTQSGSVVAKAPGEANITVICGGLIAYCKVVCDFGSAAAESEPEPEPEPEPAEPLKISAEDISFFEKGENTNLKLTGGDGSEPKWKSEDSSIATVDENGHVVAVGGGTVNVTATVGEETVKCIVRCQFE